MQDYKPLNSQSQKNNEGLFRRLFSYIVYSLFPRQQPQVDGHHSHNPMIGVPAVEGPSQHAEIQGNVSSSKSKFRTRGSNTSNEIEIEFRHTEIEQEKFNNAFQKEGNGIYSKNGSYHSVQHGHKKITNGEFNEPTAKRTVEIKGSASNNTHATQKLKKIKTTRTVSSNDSNHTSAIEEFLKSRKEAMRRYYSMDHKENH